MSRIDPKIIVAGHICLDIIPSFSYGVQDHSDLNSDSATFLKPGSLTKMGPLSFHTGGVVSNTGIALAKLGLDVKLIGKIGEDVTGKILEQILTSHQKGLARYLIKTASDSTSYSIVLNPPNIDRSFLHNPGANTSFSSTDLPKENELLSGTWFHFGYPPLMQALYKNEGTELETIFKKARSAGLITSLDMATPDEDAIKPNIDWHLILKKVLPYVDLFAPSWDEILLLLRKTQRKNKAHPLSSLETLSLKALQEVADELLAMGCKIVVIKLGEYGMYMKTQDMSNDFLNSLFNNLSTNDDPLKNDNEEAQWKVTLRTEWENLELLVPCFKTEVVGTTGAGDTTIAGLIAGFLKLSHPEDIANAASATGAFCVSQQDATSGIPTWDKILEKVIDPKEKLINVNPGKGWRYNKGVWKRKNIKKFKG